MPIDRDQAFRLLPRQGRIPVLQPDAEGVIRPLLDGKLQAPFLVPTKKLRRALAGRQRQVLCTCRSDGHENYFFAGVDEFVGVDPQEGQYVVLSPLVRVLGSTHGPLLISQASHLVCDVPSFGLLTSQAV